MWLQMPIYDPIFRYVHICCRWWWWWMVVVVVVVCVCGGGGGGGGINAMIEHTKFYYHIKEPCTQSRHHSNLLLYSKIIFFGRRCVINLRRYKKRVANSWWKLRKFCPCVTICLHKWQAISYRGYPAKGPYPGRALLAGYPRYTSSSWLPYIEGFLPKGPYLPCVSMAGRALFAGYNRN